MGTSVSKRRSWFRISVLGVLAFLLFSGLMGLWQTLSSDSMGFAPYIAKVRVSGPILNADDVLDQLKMVEEDKAAKGLLVVVDSPGGAVVPSESIYNAVKRISADRPVAVSMQSLAASGGYMVACAADRIYAYDSTLTGSIGVIMQSASVTGLLDKLGVTPQVIKSGQFKDAGSPFREMSSADREYFQALIMDLRNQFVQLVAQGRRLPMEKVSELADGRVFTGREAQRLGLVDAIGDEEDAAQWLRSQARLPKDAEVKEMDSTQTRLFKVFGEAQEQLFMGLVAAASSPRAYFF